MTGITSAIGSAARAAFREQGFVVIPGVLDDRQLACGRRTVAAMLTAEPPPAGHRGPVLPVAAVRAPTVSTCRGRAATTTACCGSTARAASATWRPGCCGRTCRRRSPTSPSSPPPSRAWPHRPGGPHVDGISPPLARRHAGHVLAAGWRVADRPQRAGPGQPLGVAGHASAVRRLPRRSTAPTRWPAPARAVSADRAGRAAAGDRPSGQRAASRTTCSRTTSAAMTARLARRCARSCTTGSQAAGHRGRWREAVTDPLSEFRAGDTRTAIVEMQAGADRVRHVGLAEPGRHRVLGPPAGAVRRDEPVRAERREVVEHPGDQRLEHRPVQVEAADDRVQRLATGQHAARTGRC